MRIPFGQAGKFRRIESRIHAGQYREMAGRRHGQFAFLSKLRGVSFVGGKYFVQDSAHAFSPTWGFETPDSPALSIMVVIRIEIRHCLDAAAGCFSPANRGD
jgi:hypothetical protein